HDGPGIRTTVFFKGCPLKCWWCHNPESKAHQPVLVQRKERCIGCLSCADVCRSPENCIQCGACTVVCGTGVREIIGKRMTIRETMQRIEKDRVFFEKSGGGVTFSGGEPLTQPEFLCELLKESQSRGIHTAVDTSGYAPWAVIERVAKNTDLFLYDLKHMDSVLHKEITGVSNELIVDNLKKLAAIHQNIIARIPIIRGVNDDLHNIMQTGAFLNSINIKEVCILPYHNIGVDKYALIGEKYDLPEALVPTEEEMQAIVRVLASLGLSVRIGG
ncbi:MAG: glycyl-radical enzyme activating protein, partial [bacterium]|nr:glycyl-radical enzyme activating protein [bacterium]